MDDAKGGQVSKEDAGDGEADGGISVKLDGTGVTEQDGERPSKRIRREGEFVGDAGDTNLSPQDRLAVNGNPAESRDELTVDEDDDLAEVEQQFEREEGAGHVDNDDEEEQTDEEPTDEESDDEDEEDEEDELDGSELDTNARLNVLQEGPSSGVDEGSQDESD